MESESPVVSQSFAGKKNSFPKSPLAFVNKVLRDETLMSAFPCFSRETTTVCLIFAFLLRSEEEHTRINYSVKEFSAPSLIIDYRCTGC